MDITLALLPDFALILTGFLLRRVFHLDNIFWVGLEKLIYFVLFPALLFFAIARSPIQLGTALPLMISGLATMTTGIILGYLALHLFAMPPLLWAAQAQGAYRFNSYIGLAIAGNLYGLPGITAMGLLIGATVPLANMAAVWGLARHGNLSIWREIARNPLVLSTLAGFAWSLSGLTIPLPVVRYLGRLSEASITLGLLAVGAALQLRGALPDGNRRAAAWFLGIKLLGLPAAAWSLALLIGLHRDYRNVLVIYAALPIASSAYILAQRMGGDGRSVAWLISASTLAAMMTLPVWVIIFR